VPLPGYVAVTIVGEALSSAVMVTVQEPTPRLACASTHGPPLKARMSGNELRVTVPVGVDLLAGSLISVTVTVTVVLWPSRNEVRVEETIVEVARLFTVWPPEPVLPR
jgi:hypothetical protein